MFYYITLHYIYTDHKPLVSLYGNPNSKPPARIERWSLRLQPYDALFIYRTGSYNPADYMSRHPVIQIKSSSGEEKIAEEYINYLTNVLVPKAMTLEEVRLATQHDATLQEVIRAIETNVWHNTVEHPVNKQSFDAHKKINFEEGVILYVSDRSRSVTKCRSQPITVRGSGGAL